MYRKMGEKLSSPARYPISDSHSLKKCERVHFFLYFFLFSFDANNCVHLEKLCICLILLHFFLAYVNKNLVGMKISHKLRAFLLYSEPDPV